MAETSDTLEPTMPDAGAESAAAADAAPTVAATDAAAPAAMEVQSQSPAPTVAAPKAPSTKKVAHSYDELPTYTRNLLHVEVPISVTLTMKKQSVDQIVDLAPGSLIQFDKSCDELLDLCVGDHRIAQGLAVKVGEKFGLRINQITPPSERMQSLRPQAT
ncbi:MAG TPA: FliM/FliN family flagellar motor C-terminal domain-containing protein [Pirellulales bacterium]